MFVRFQFFAIYSMSSTTGSKMNVEKKGGKFVSKLLKKRKYPFWVRNTSGLGAEPALEWNADDAVKRDGR